MQTLTLSTTAKKQILDITKIVNDFLIKNYYDTGLVILFSRHTTCCLATADMDPGTDQDYLNSFEAMAPRIVFKHPHDPSHFGDHLFSTMVGASLSIPVQSASMVLGTYQKVVLIELAGPKERRVELMFIPEPKK